MADQAARNSQLDSDSALQNQGGAQSGSSYAGDRRVTADSFRQLLARLKKTTDSPETAQTQGGTQLQPEAAPLTANTPAPQPAALEATEARPTVATATAPTPRSEIKEPSSDKVMPPPPPAMPAERQLQIDLAEKERRERARAEVHAASQEIIARLRKAATSAQGAVAELTGEVTPVAKAETPAEPARIDAPSLPEPEAISAPAQTGDFDTTSIPMPGDVVVDSHTAQQPMEAEVYAEPASAAVAEQQDLSAAAQSTAHNITEQVAAITEQVAAVTEQVAAVTEQVAAPVAIQTQPEPDTNRRRHPFFPDVFVDDEGHVVGAAVAEAPAPVEQSVVDTSSVEPEATQDVAPQGYVETEYTQESIAAATNALIRGIAQGEQPLASAPHEDHVETAAAVEPEAEVAQHGVVTPHRAEPQAPAPVEVPQVAQAPVAEVVPLPVAEVAPPPVADVAPAPIAEAPADPATPPASDEDDDGAGHREDLIDDEADAVKHLHGVEVKGIGDIARSVFSAPTPAERAAFLAEVAELSAPAAEASPKEVLAASKDALNKPQSSVRKIALQDDPFAKIAPDVSSHVNNEAPDEDSGELARSLLDMMLSSPNAGLPQERALAADALLKLVPKIPTKALVTIAERLSHTDQPPHLLIARLINDPRIEISGPLLEQCNHINDQVLGKVIASGQISLQRLIARRRHLSPALTDQLIDFDDASVILTLVRNAGATFAHTAFNRLVDHAARNPAILAPLATRADLPAPVAFELFWLVPAQLRRYLLSRFLTDSETLTKILKITKVMQGGSDSEGHDFANKEDIGAFMAALTNGEQEIAEAKLASIAGISAACAKRIVNDRQGEPLAIIFKAIGLNRQQFEECMSKLKEPAINIIDEDRQVLELLSIFNSMSFNKARILLTYWDWAVLEHGPYAKAS